MVIQRVKQDKLSILVVKTVKDQFITYGILNISIYVSIFLFSVATHEVYQLGNIHQMEPV
jgi:hypothetical protein